MTDHTWNPWAVEKVEDLVAREVRHLTSDACASWSTVRVPPEITTTSSGPGADGQSYWVVARRDDRVLYWDSIEEEFGTGRVRAGLLVDYGTYGEQLSWSLGRLLGDPNERLSG